MTEAEDKLSIRRDLVVQLNAPHVWAFVCDMGNWASLMPGYISHESLGQDDSVWTLQVDIGPFKRPVAINVHVLRWDEPRHVAFEIKGKHDPFIGSGSFYSEAIGEGTRIELAFRAEPTGSMSRMLVPLVPPILRQVADHFAASLQNALNKGSTTDHPIVHVPKTRQGFWSLLWSRFQRRSIH